MHHSDRGYSGYFPRSKNDTRLQRVWNHIAFFLGIYFLFLFIPFAIWLGAELYEFPLGWLLFLLPFPLMFLSTKRAKREGAEINADFFQFMRIATEKESSVASDTQELYEMLADTSGLHSLPKIESGILTWELYQDACVTAYNDGYDTMVAVTNKHILKGYDMHWHPEPEDVYDDLLTLGKKGNILVLRKRLSGIEVYYSGDPGYYRFSPEKKRHWGRLIYLSQR